MRTADTFSFFFRNEIVSQRESLWIECYKLYCDRLVQGRRGFVVRLSNASPTGRCVNCRREEERIMEVIAQFIMKFRKRRLLKTLTKAQEMYNDDKYVKAIALYERVLAMVDASELSRRVSAYEKIAEMYGEHELYADAQDAYRSAVALAPNRSDLRFAFGVCLLKLNEAQAAREQFGHAFWLVSSRISELRQGAEYLSNHGLSDLAKAWKERAEDLEDRKSWKEE